MPGKRPLKIVLHKQVAALHGGALLGVAYKFPRKTISTAVPSNGSSNGGGFMGEEGPGTRVIGEAPANFQLYR
jgi:hypothetical protein